ncbi:hypothetical protein AVEN_77496-1 [Araneus ventricosus]|uniref:DDE Tnp4 domain-containing protein n=1 Tax=Araneus ventricosus TaxID=182803 RepID=A0A4Y2A9Q0_ARAVE|nr:hypothetical protein AVEN_233396-1 [Araneus ventricosus]GBL76543.1 hypothetical protein AVEN_77496-1 [Araneus ventricosus]
MANHLIPASLKTQRYMISLSKRSLDIPAASPLEGGKLFPYVILADQGFAMSENLIRSCGGKGLSDEKNIFNYRLSRARRCIECAFGIMACKWRIFYRSLNVDFELAENIVKAVCVLHNFVRRRDVHRKSEQSAFYDIENDSTSRVNPKVLNIRDQFAKYFVKNPSEWQNKKM